MPKGRGANPKRHQKGKGDSVGRGYIKLLALYEDRPAKPAKQRVYRPSLLLHRYVIQKRVP